MFQDQIKTEYYGTTQLEQRSRSPSPTQSAQSLPLQQLRRFPGRFFTGAKRRLLPNTPGSLKKKKQPPVHLQLGKVDQSLAINFPLVSHSPTIPTRTPAVINFPKLNASPTHYMKHAPILPGTGEFPVQQSDDQQLMQLPPPLQPQPGVWMPAQDGDGQMQFGEFVPQTVTDVEFGQQPVQQAPQPSSRFAPMGASLTSLLAPLRVFGRSSSQSRQPQSQAQVQQATQQQPKVLDGTGAQAIAPLSIGTVCMAAVPTAPSAVGKRNQFGEKRELPQPPGVYYPSSSMPGPSTFLHQPLPTWPEESATIAQAEYATSAPKPISDMAPITYHPTSFSEGLPSQESLPSGGTGSGRMLPAQPGTSSQAPGTMMRSMEFPRTSKMARERMKIRSSTWTDETYCPEEGGSGAGRYISGGPRRRQPPIPAHIKRPSSAGVLMTPSGAPPGRQFALAKAVPYGYGTHPQPRRITPPVPRARRKPPLHQHSFHSDGADVTKADDDDEDWC